MAARVCVLDREVEAASGQNFAKPRHRAGQAQTGITAAGAEKEQDREPGMRSNAIKTRTRSFRAGVVV